jgi:predicted DNA-binding transcriptional regulator AlpA
MQKQNLLNTEQAAEYTGLSAPTLARMRQQDTGPVYCKMGGRVFYLREDLDAWIAACRVKSGSE